MIPSYFKIEILAKSKFWIKYISQALMMESKSIHLLADTTPRTINSVLSHLKNPQKVVWRLVASLSSNIWHLWVKDLKFWTLLCRKASA